jgi:hypothetical protein
MSGTSPTRIRLPEKHEADPSLAHGAGLTKKQLQAVQDDAWSERQIVDLTMRLALCAAWNKFNDALGLDTETPFQHAFAELGVA